MSPERTIFLFAFYLLGLGAILVVAPNPLLGLFGFPPTEEVWIRIVGVLVLLLAFYYFSAARSENTEFMRWTVYGRFSILVFFAAFVIAGLAKPVLLLLAAIDVAGAGLTWTALRSVAPKA